MEDRDSRERLLAAAWDLAVGAFDVSEGVTRTTPRVFDQLTAARVSQRAGLTTGAFYNRWLDRDEFLVDFLEYALSITRVKAMDVVLELLEDPVGMTPEDLMMQAIKRTVDAALTDPAFAMHMYLWALTRNREVVVEHLKEGYAESRGKIAELVALFFGGAGREIKTPFTTDAVAAMMIALVEGLALQRGVDPERISMDVVEQAVVAIVSVVAQPIDQHRQDA